MNVDIKGADVLQLNGLALAYMGDAVLETYVRRHILASGIVNPNKLHRTATSYVSAKAQAKVIRYLLDNGDLSEVEISIVKRGRNAKSGTVPKNTDVQTYRYATAYESLLGYLYLLGDIKRVEYLISLSIDILTDGKEG